MSHIVIKDLPNLIKATKRQFLLRQVDRSLHKAMLRNQTQSHINTNVLVNHTVNKEGSSCHQMD